MIQSGRHFVNPSHLVRSRLLTGAIIGAVLVNAAKSNFSELFPEAWSYFLGILFILVVLLFPDGIMGLFNKLPRRFGQFSLNGNIAKMWKSIQKK
jgi:hypothetical protein